MLSRAAFVAHRSIIVRPQFLIASFRGAQEPQNDIHRRQYHVANLKTLESSKILTACIVNNKNTIGLLSSRNFSRTSQLRNVAPPLSTAPTLGSISDAPSMESLIEMVGTEPTLESLGLGGWSPIGIMQQCLEYLHVTCDLPWWVSIVAITACIRVLVIPLVIIDLQKTTKLVNKAMPEISKIQNDMGIARLNKDDDEVTRLLREQAMVMKKHGVNPLKQSLVPLCRAPFVISLVWGLKEMISAPVTSLSTGGVLWFSDLTIIDPFYLIPAISSLTMLATFEINMIMGAGQEVDAPRMRTFLRIMPTLLLPITTQLPAAILCYWTTSNVISLIQSVLLKIPAVRDLCKIERFAVHTIENKKDDFIGRRMKRLESDKMFQESASELWGGAETTGLPSENSTEQEKNQTKIKSAHKDN